MNKLIGSTLTRCQNDKYLYRAWGQKSTKLFATDKLTIQGKPEIRPNFVAERKKKLTKRQSNSYLYVTLLDLAIIIFPTLISNAGLLNNNNYLRRSVSSIHPTQRKTWSVTRGFNEDVEKRLRQTVFWVLDWAKIDARFSKERRNLSIKGYDLY